MANSAIPYNAIEVAQARNLPVGSAVSFTARPYERLMVFIPTFFNVNALKYKTMCLPVHANETSKTISYLVQDGGTLVQSGVSVDAWVILLPISG